MDDVIPISGCELTVLPEPWPWAVSERKRIERFWAKAAAANSALFNGPVYMLTDHELREGRLRGVVQPANFASLLFWREEGFPEAGALNCFGSAVIRSREGHVLFGRMGPQTANAGKVYPAGGSFSDDDITGGRLDVERNITRELEEETAIRPDEAIREPGYLLVKDGPRLSLAAQFRLDEPSAGLRERIRNFLKDTADPELDEIVIFRRSEFCAHHHMPGYARRLVEHLLGEAKP